MRSVTNISPESSIPEARRNSPARHLGAANVTLDPFADLERIARLKLAKLDAELAQLLPAKSTVEIPFKDAHGHDVKVVYQDTSGAGERTLTSIEVCCEHGKLKIFPQKGCKA